jgi:NADH:ubiquinone oxidoreductase subunit E
VITLVEGTKEKLGEILSQYKGKKSDLIPILQEAQDNFGYLPGEVMQEIAKFLRMSNGNVYGVATFYTRFKLTPGGKKIIRVCVGVGCHVCGGARILREVENRLGIKPGETTDDLEYSLETVACSGSCALAPVLVVDGSVYGRMTTTKVGEILEETK